MPQPIHVNKNNLYTFSRLAPFIQEYIYNHNWTELRPVQIAACQVIFDTDAHLLIAAATAAGKTEAAFLPILTLLHENPSSTIGALYIGPIKALINDQFERLHGLLKEADIPVWHWHGDVSQSHKNQLLKNPLGILQITPESLESLLINKYHDIKRLFGDLRFVVIDEIHAFMGTERGCQILCQLARLEDLTQKQPRRIGLSATLGDYALAEEWLCSGSKKSVITPKIERENRQIRLAVEHFFVSVDDEFWGKKNRRDAESADIREGREGKFDIDVYERYIFNLSKNRKCLIFANNKSQTEAVIASLRKVAMREGEADIYHVHHGSISASLRQVAENAMREPNRPAVTAATLTLELGIDIGYLERVIQLEAPLSVASFLQRLGRTGRRGEAADMRFVCAENEVLSEATLPEQIPWQLLQCIAIIQLYLEEKWIEPIKPVKYPFSLLYHQTMSIVVAVGEISPATLAQKVLSLPVFTAVSRDDLKLLLRYLIDINHLQLTEEGKLILGLAGERVVGKFQFYAVFPDNEEFLVKQGATEIGSISLPSPVGNQFALAGKTWEVVEVDFKKKIILVKQVEGQASIFWRGGSGTIHTRILQRMRQVLFEDTEYPYLQSNAMKRLRVVRELTRNSGLDQKNILLLAKNKSCIFPWMGTVAYRTLERLLNMFCRESLAIKSIGGVNPYYLIIKLDKTKVNSLYPEILSLCEQRITAENLLSDAEAPEIQKYDKFIPHALLRKAFASDHLDMEELRQLVGLW
ncbi:DEAD/DEAH box helicase [Fischerella thermalis]|jgi:ATP-dependent Lhr-like helicase|uniref:DEAD/DEAH box helicase n=3 Tax=Fischerella thermalis TaxID=372787 RepID=UPI0002D983DB|nr:DEAD/DEAH box helicase [Fischerella thermalis]PLZ04645.1 ATP-dependent helicase [Fischerella thermalis WC119]PLZ05834.1 ATP-dependent helicase [Fischerella thermalis WC114]PLZ16617.1 ATP-dependent helicase [Fischerella thermalis WC341]PLZ24714.1 ATP-dependent helicase [Fischerella thermalis WC157]PLZ28520.1 ATP-dependent helicase [Fischerella thermalis WC559]